MTGRSLIAAHPAARDDIADLVTRRPLPGPGLPQIDPFLFLNHHGPQTYPPGNAGLPFGPHPHRGFETVTFILEGSLAHHDTGGHAYVVDAGGVQWMTAGSGLIHAELSPPAFQRDGGPMEILQLWVNLPARLKMTAPRYTGVQADAIPALPLGQGSALRLIAGSFDGKQGPVESLTSVFMSVVALGQGAEVYLPAPAGRSVFLYVVRGGITVGGAPVREWHLAELDRDGDSVAVASDGGALLLFGHADPIDEPVVAHGPFVMNRREEITQAIHDYQAGKFGDPAGLRL
ncbi:pirin family protein [Sphingomonas sp. ac-8]|uniref:pirin family protein n=1 Tax=Sphingomonas sp. ac-8 TaxID=3242977 RepID=UPI003A805897